MNALVLTCPYVWKIPSGAFSDNQPINGRCGCCSGSLTEYLIQFIEKLEQERYLQKFTITISHTYRRGHPLLRYRYMHCCSTIHSITYRYFWTQEGVPCTIFQICMLCIDSDIYSGYYTLSFFVKWPLYWWSEGQINHQQFEGKHPPNPPPPQYTN